MTSLPKVFVLRNESVLETDLGFSFRLFSPPVNPLRPNYCVLGTGPRRNLRVLVEFYFRCLKFRGGKHFFGSGSFSTERTPVSHFNRRLGREG